MKNKEQSRQVLGKSKRIKDATLLGKKTTDMEVVDPEVLIGDKDTPPLEMTEDLNAELMEEEREKEEKQKEIRSKTEHFTNGVNEWQLIAKTYNNILDWEHVTTAMQVGNGCLICVKEAIGQRMHSTMTFVPLLRLVKEDKKWFLI